MPSDRLVSFAGEPAAEITRRLAAAGAGDARAFEEAFALVYDQLRRLAATVRAGRAGDTLSATALVHEAWFKLAPGVGDAAAPQWAGRTAFFRIAARAMRQVLVDAARERTADKRGGGAAAVTLDEAVAVAAGRAADDVLALDDALARLEARSARQARVVELRFFAGLSVEECADVLGLSTPTVQRDWRAARAWLAATLAAGDAA